MRANPESSNAMHTDAGTVDARNTHAGLSNAMRAKIICVVFSAAVVLGIVWPFLFPGQLAWRDMLVLDSPGLTSANFGGGDLFARNAPQDGFLAIIGMVLPATIVVKAMMVLSAASAAYGAWLLSNRELLPALAAIGLAVCNPFIIERLLQGHWSLVIAAWLLPLIAATGLAGQALIVWLLLFLTSLTPTGAIIGLIVALVCLRTHRLITLGLGVFYMLPWAIPGIIATFTGAQEMNAQAAAEAFAPRAEEAVGTFGAILGLGGIWNADAVPESRHLGFALFGFGIIACVLLGARFVPKRLVVLALIGIGLTTAAWLWPSGMAWALDYLPGAGLMRDSQKLLMLAIPFYVAGLGNIDRTVPAAIALGCVILQTPDASSSLAVLKGHTGELVDEKLIADAAGRDVLFVDRDTLVDVEDSPVIDPYSKALNKVESGSLTVDGEVIDLPSARWVASVTAWEDKDLEVLEELGVGVIVEDEEIIAETNAPAYSPPWILTSAWMLGPIIAALAALAIVQNGRRLNPMNS